MITALSLLSFILIYCVTRLSFKISNIEKISQYNLEAYNKKLEEIEASFEFEREQSEHLLERIHDLERK